MTKNTYCNLEALENCDGIYFLKFHKKGGIMKYCHCITSNEETKT